jgi:hypothetical protein
MACSPKTVLGGPVNITNPDASEDPVLVRQAPSPAGCNCNLGGSGTGPAGGFICAKGTADPAGAAKPVRVYGKVQAEGAGDPGLDTSDRCLAEGLVLPDGSWIISRTAAGTGAKNDIPCAQCGPANAPVGGQQVRVWVVYDDDVTSVHSAAQPFKGICSTQTQCDEGSSSSAFAAQSTFAMAPRQWHLQTKGFGKGKTKFNASWTLSLTPASECLWVNEGDGDRKVRVELSFDPKRSMEWQLVLRLRKTSVVYYQTNQNWLWTRGNDLLFTSGDPQKKGVPAKVQVTLQ